MKNVALCLSASVLALASGTSCSLINGQDITYAVDPQELSQDISKDFTAMGTLPTIDCTTSDALCSAMAVPGLPASAQIACEASSAGQKQCVVHYDLSVPVKVDLSKQASFPSAVTSSGVINQVTIDEVRYWAGAGHMVNVATPPIDIYVANQNATAVTDPSASKLGTIASIPAGMPPSMAPDCKGPATSASAFCDLQLSDAGKGAFATLAKNYQTPFNILLVGHLTLAGGVPFPQGKVDLFLQPVLGFHL
jgi:hypothetical protein